ncbi:hypothetical protein JCM13664_10520 [Methylothermus subterraneus]
MPGFLLWFALLATAWVYAPGLSGGFYFDDFVHIVENPFVKLERLSLDGLRQAANSSLAGPTGRPIALVSFALDHLAHGGNPAYMKAVNVALHLGCGLGIYALLWRLLPFLGMEKAQGRLWAAGAAALWLLHPLHVSAVLYTVQRMTLLAAFFMLLGLVGYVRFRRQNRLGLALLSLALGAALATLSKENGLLAPVYAALIELGALRFRGLSPGQTRALKALFYSGAAVVGLFALGYLAWHPDWFTRAYAGRDFNAIERLLTEARALAFYQRLIVLPDLSAMGLYHDDYPLSRSLWEPPATALALLWHVGLLVGAWRLRRALPLLSFGIAWFYASHLLESTVWPLELVFEHRNYLAVLGPVLALLGGLQWLKSRLGEARRFAPRPAWIGLGIAVLWGGATWVRAADWGDFFGHALMEAERHPNSARSQFEAGQTLARGLFRHPEHARPLLPRAMDYYWAAVRLDSHGIAPLVSLLYVQKNAVGQVDPNIMRELLHRLEQGKPDAATSINLHALMRQILDDRSGLLTPWAEAVFAAALSNARLAPRDRAEVLVGQALYRNGQGANPEEVIPLLQEACALVPQKLDYRILLAAEHLDAGHLETARQILAETEAKDRYGVVREEVAHLKERLTHLLPTQ